MCCFITSVRFLDLRPRYCEYFHFIILDSMMSTLYTRNTKVFCAVYKHLCLHWKYYTFDWLSGMCFGLYSLPF